METLIYWIINDYLYGLVESFTSPQKRVSIVYLVSAIFIALVWLAFLERRFSRRDFLATITRIFSKVKTVLWNGPLGAFEYKPFNSSTTVVAKFLSKNIKKYGINVIVGGGDTIASLKNLNVINKCSYVSTSGGAFLEFLEGKELPGIKALKKNKLH